MTVPVTVIQCETTPADCTWSGKGNPLAYMQSVVNQQAPGVPDTMQRTLGLIRLSGHDSFLSKLSRRRAVTKNAIGVFLGAIALCAILYSGRTELVFPLDNALVVIGNLCLAGVMFLLLMMILCPLVWITLSPLSKTDCFLEETQDSGWHTGFFNDCQVLLSQGVTMPAALLELMPCLGDTRTSARVLEALGAEDTVALIQLAEALNKAVLSTQAAKNDYQPVPKVKLTGATEELLNRAKNALTAEISDDDPKARDLVF